MSIELKIEEGRWSPRRLRGFLDDWHQRAPVRVLATTGWQTSLSGSWTWLFGEGSTRGCSLRYKPSLVKSATLFVRLNTMASRADWMLAHALARDLVKTAGGRALGADDRVLRAEDLSESNVAAEAMARIRVDAASIARALRGGQPFAALPTPRFSLILTASMLPQEDDPADLGGLLEEHLAGMAARYAEAEDVKPLQLPDGSMLSVWSGRPALVHLVHHFGVQHGGTPEEGVVLPAAKAIEILGSRLEVVSPDADRFYVPELHPASDGALLQQLLAAGQPVPAFLGRYRQQRQASPF